MARQNKVTLWGKLLSDPMISVDPITHEPKKLSFFMSVVNQERNTNLNENDVIYSEPFIYSQDEKIIKNAIDWKKGDLVDVRGVFTTLDAKRGTQCIHCGDKQLFDGEISVVVPTFVERRYTGLDDKEADRIMREHREVSNNVNLIGYLCGNVIEEKKPKIYGDIISRNAYKGISKFQLAVNRSFFVSADKPQAKTDYPHIISVGENAEKDAICLHEASEVGIDGMIVTRKFRRTFTCAKCGQKFDKDECVTEVLTYNTEYLNNFEALEGSAAEIKAKQKEEMLASAIEKLKKD